MPPANQVPSTTAPTDPNQPVQFGNPVAGGVPAAMFAAQQVPQAPVLPGMPAAAPVVPAAPSFPAATATPAATTLAAQQPAAPRPASTQNSLLFSEIRDNMVIMADGSFRAVIACKSINFDLMSNREREAIEFSYQNFLNALFFPVQILVRSQRVDLGPYLDKLLETRRGQDNMLLGVLMDDYINFIDVLSQEANIMAKSFFVVVPYFPTGDAMNVNSVVQQSKGFLAKLMPAKTAAVTKIDKATYERAKDEIKNRVDAVINSLTQVGIHTAQLTTKELGELYYNVYNPDTAVREPLGNFSDITTTYVRKGAIPGPEAVNG